MQQQRDTCRWLCNSREIHAGGYATAGRYMPVAMQQQGDTCRWLCNSREMQADSTAKTGRY
jgi:hypothetical protein